GRDLGVSRRRARRRSGPARAAGVSHGRGVRPVRRLRDARRLALARSAGDASGPRNESPLTAARGVPRPMLWATIGLLVVVAGVIAAEWWLAHRVDDEPWCVWAMPTGGIVTWA